MDEDNLNKAELALIGKILSGLGLSRFRDILVSKVRYAFDLAFRTTQIDYDFDAVEPDDLALR